MPNPVLSIVVGTYNRRDQIQECVESIARETTVPHIVYVTDAGSTDGTVEYLNSVASDTVRPILVGEKLGQARAYNDVFDQVQTPYVCWISDDNVIVDNGLDRAVAVLQGNARIGMIALKVRDKIGPFTKAPYIGGLSSLGVLNVNQGMLPTKVMKEVGGFSELFRDYGIDPDITAKVLFSGYDVVYSRRVAIHHYRNWSVDPSAPEYHALKAKHERSIKLYEAKYGNYLPQSVAFDFKKRLYRGLTKALGQRWGLNSAEPVAGLLPRDWHNIFNCRFISLVDPLLCAGKSYHLRQRWPSKKSIPGGPPEPALPGDC
ncbi:glycosyltransferase family 2 protein [Magnetospirillum fulvum]|uniref:Glycosyltransferase, GT2 family n=1 Tax=Magnetospirillum fulvum TaxID=1082 RepID=A0A1H6H3H6_MAGFU|nr:glycosyltransferase [Magnetospirillum fulvum]SEH30241.1 Glycosyltransferase, GT2 family [Magnetospirillum fulvum]